MDINGVIVLCFILTILAIVISGSSTELTRERRTVHNRGPNDCWSPQGYTCCRGWVRTHGSRRCIRHWQPSLPKTSTRARGRNCDEIKCEHNCDVNEGTAVCFCMRGFRLQPDGFSCRDINECARMSKCQHGCRNTIGRYMCTCRDGYSLQSDGSTCRELYDYGDSECGNAQLCPDDAAFRSHQPADPLGEIFPCRGSQCPRSDPGSERMISDPADFWKWLLMKYRMSKENFQAPPEQHDRSTYNNHGPCLGYKCFAGRPAVLVASPADLKPIPEGRPCNSDDCSAELSNSGIVESRPCIAKDCHTGITECKGSGCDMKSYEESNDNSQTRFVKGEEYAPCVDINCESRRRSSTPCRHGDCYWEYLDGQKHVNPDVEYPHPKRGPYEIDSHVKSKPTKTIKDIEPAPINHHKTQRYVKRINKKHLNTKFVNMLRTFNFKYSVTTARTVDYRKIRPVEQIYHTTAQVPLSEGTFSDDKSSNDAPCTGDHCLSPQAKQLRNADCPKGYTAILQNNFVLCAPPDDADEFQGLLPVCPWGQQLIFSSEGVICKDQTTQEEVRCPEGQFRISTPEGMVCQRYVTDSNHCPPGHVLTETTSGSYCKEETTDNTIQCNKDQDVVTTNVGTLCQDRARPCPTGLVALDTPIGIVCTYDTGAQNRNDRDIKGTDEDITEATTPSGCPLDRLSLDGKTCKDDSETPKYIPDSCPRGQILHDTDLGLKCLPIRNQDLTKLTCLEGQPCFVEKSPTSLLCNDGSRPIVLYAGKKICQDGSTPQKPSLVGNLCPDGTRMVTLHGKKTCETHVAQTPGCIPGDNCDGASHPHPCPLGLIPVSIRGKMECRYQDIENGGEDICPSGLKWVTIHEHGRCFDITTTDVNEICPNGETLLSVGNGYQCEPAEEKINCPYGTKIKITENGPRCAVDKGENSVAFCSEGEILVTDHRGKRCFTMTGEEPLCEKGFLPQISDAGVTCIPDNENETTKCPEGFVVKGTETEPYCEPVVEPLCPEGYTVSASAGWPLCVLTEAETCPPGYVTNQIDGDPPCLTENKPTCSSSRMLNVLLGKSVCGSSPNIQENSQPCSVGSGHPACSRQTPDCSKNYSSGKCQTKKCPIGQKLIERNKEYLCEVVPALEYGGCNPQCATGGSCANGACVCTPGVYGQTCQIDIDECQQLEHDFCEYRCQNNFASFQCICPPGSTLNSDGRTCKVIECIPDCMNAGICIDGICDCRSGFTGTFCQEDIDECYVQHDICGDICRNTYGSYVCLCPPGSRLNEDQRSCHNATCIPGCRNGGTCENHRCNCPAGFYGIICQLDINECYHYKPCSHHCTNTRGSYTCSCPKGSGVLIGGHTCKIPGLPVDQTSTSTHPAESNGYSESDHEETGSGTQFDMKI